MFEVVTEFEKEIAKFFGSPYAVAVDCCTHGIELCLREQQIKKIIVPKRTYLSVPMLANKLNIELEWKDEEWQDYYYIGDTNIIDAAVLWKRDSYIPGTYMCISFQFRKHLKLGRGGVILTDNKESAKILKMMSYDGRDNSSNKPWVEQDVQNFGFHYYMTPEVAQKGIDKLPEAINSKPRQWKLTDWPDLTEMACFKKEKNE
jgi:dTDP-4-amino-4,6-dideoxygalactose transaminase